MLNGKKTLIGLGIAFVAKLLDVAGYPGLDAAEMEAATLALVQAIDAAATFGGIALAVYGRIVATRRVLTEQPLK